MIIWLKDFKKHPFFDGIDWENIRKMTPPYIPEIQSPTDTSNFPDEHEDFRISAQAPKLGNASFSGKNLPFIGFTFTRNSKLSDTGMQNLVKSQESDISEKSEPTAEKSHNGTSENGTGQQTAYIKNLEQSLNKIKIERGDLRTELTEIKEKMKLQYNDLNKKIIMVSESWKFFKRFMSAF